MTPEQAKAAGKQAFKESKRYEAAVYAPQNVRAYWKAGYLEAKKEHAAWLTTPEGIEFTRAKVVAEVRQRAKTNAFLRDAILELELAILADQRAALKRMFQFEDSGERNASYGSDERIILHK